MRVLVLSTDRGFGMGARLLTDIGASLAARGDTVAVVCCRGSDTERAMAKRHPDLPRRAIGARGLATRVLAMRQVIRSTRAEAVLVGTDRDLTVAALAIGRQGGVVRRLAIGERFEPGFTTRFALARSSVLVMGDEISSNAHTSTHVRAAIGWPRIAARDADVPFRQSPSVPPPMLAIVAGANAESAPHAAGAAALRAASRLMSRHPDLRVTLLGEPADLQSLRVHAGSVGMADRLTVLPLDALIEPGPFTAAAVWVTAQGDSGAVSLVSAMMRRIPCIVPRGFDTEALVAQRITGFVADEGDLAGSVSALAHLLADADAHHAMGAAAAARAERLHGWDAVLDRTSATLARAAGVRRAMPDAA